MNLFYTTWLTLLIVGCTSVLDKSLQEVNKPSRWINIDTEEARYVCFRGTLEGAHDKISLNGVQYNCKEME